MAMKLDRFRPSARMKIEPWLVQAALARLGERRLTVEEQAEIVAVTRAPGRVRWPEWWICGLVRCPRFNAKSLLDTRNEIDTRLPTATTAGRPKRRGD
jgi:hypothetical protein